MLLNCRGLPLWGGACLPRSGRGDSTFCSPPMSTSWRTRPLWPRYWFLYLIGTCYQIFIPHNHVDIDWVLLPFLICGRWLLPFLNVGPFCNVGVGWVLLLQCCYNDIHWVQIAIMTKSHWPWWRCYYRDQWLAGQPSNLASASSVKLANFCIVYE